MPQSCEILPTTDSLMELGRITCLLNDRDEQLIREKDDLSLMAKIIGHANKSTTHKELFATILDEISEYLGMDGNAACLVNPKLGVARIVKHAGLEQRFLDKYISCNIHKEPYSQIFVEGHTLLGENLKVDAPQIYDKYQVQSYIIAPLVSPCGVVGAILFFSRQYTEVDEHTREFISSISQYISDALRRIWAEINLIKERDALLDIRINLEAHMQELQATEEDLKDQIDKMQDQTNLMNALIRDLPIPVFYKSVKGVYEFCNPAFYEAYGMGITEVIGKTTAEVFPYDSTTIMANEAELLKNKKPLKFTCENPSPIEPKPVIVIKTPHLSNKGEVLGIISCTVDLEAFQIL